MNEYKNNRCLNCNEEIENDDNFCYNCGHWTAKGYIFLKDKTNVENIENGYVYKQDNNFRKLLILTCSGFALFIVLTLIRGNSLFKPYFFIKKSITSYIYGYNSSIIQTNNQYNNIYIGTLNDASNMIKKDFEEQKWQCSSNQDISLLEQTLEENYNIINISFCDMSKEEAEKIANTIKKVYDLFPNIKGALSNITITNANTKSEYIAYFQPSYQFVNPNNDISTYNKVNKTQILLNSYYFLNENIISNPIEEVIDKNWYVSGATWESTIAHELGHYITFKLLLKENNIDNIILVTKDNENQINNIINDFDSGNFALSIINNALNNYNTKYNKNISLEDFASSISSYAGYKDENNQILYNETIAEAIHDYYLNGNSCSQASYEIIKIITSKL